MQRVILSPGQRAPQQSGIYVHIHCIIMLMDVRNWQSNYPAMDSEISQTTPLPNAARLCARLECPKRNNYRLKFCKISREFEWPVAVYPRRRSKITPSLFPSHDFADVHLRRVAPRRCFLRKRPIFHETKNLSPFSMFAVLRVNEDSDWLKYHYTGSTRGRIYACKRPSVQSRPCRRNAEVLIKFRLWL